MIVLGLVTATSIELTEYEKSSNELGGTRFERVVRFATVDGVKAGWLSERKA